MTTLGAMTFPALGTNATVVATDVRSLDTVERAVRGEIDAIDRTCSRFRDDSELADLHERAGDRWTLVSPLLYEAIEIALGAARATDGAVDPTIGEALRDAGYDRDFAQVTSSTHRVEHRPAPGWAVVGLDADRCAVLLPAGVRIDLGATAKALAVDRACVRAVEAAGCGVLVAIGGDIAVFGEPPPGLWTVSIGDDHAEPGHPGETVAIATGGLATSSTTVRRWMRGGVVQHHVIDPLTGAPAAEVWRTVSVAAARCVDANTATTAAIVMGERAVGWLESIGVPARLVRPDGSVVRVCDWPEARAA
jgi:thiamine biosynthesis lipoprotein